MWSPDNPFDDNNVYWASDKEDSVHINREFTQNLKIIDRKAVKREKYEGLLRNVLISFLPLFLCL